MADLVKIFRDVGVAYRDEALQDYNQIDVKTIEKIALVDIDDMDRVEIYDKEAIRSRLFLRVTSSNGGNLYPFFFYTPDKLKEALKKAFKNMRRYLDEARREELRKFDERIDADRIEALLEPYKEIKNLYLALTVDGKTFYELFPEVAQNYAQKVCEGVFTKRGASYFSDDMVIGYDAGLNFCSVNELPKPLQKITKYRLLPLGRDEACLVKQGFVKLFEAKIFRFSLFGLNYYLLPTLFFEEKRHFFDKLAQLSREDSGSAESKVMAEKQLQRLAKGLVGERMGKKVLLSFLFAHKQNNAIDLHHLIEDVAPSRIVRAFALMDEDGMEGKASRFIKVKNRELHRVYLGDYIEDGLLLAKLIFGKESIPTMPLLERWVARKIFYGDNRENGERRELSEIVHGYYIEDIDFKKHQRFLDFLRKLGVVGFNVNDYLHENKEVRMQEGKRFSQLAKEKFEAVELLRQKPRAREFYVLGALAKFVMDWQYQNGSDALQKYLDGIGALSMQNSDRVFRKIYEASRKYSMYGSDYDDLMTLYAEVKETLKKEDIVSIDQANIAFVMGAVDLKTYRENRPKKEENNG
ncbi:TM1802 family CRISPR-associated protein [Hydrogenimonas cancrithermarum]|nr:TM1802 family CRISPR-associated protein [Hydrogenimonas cancrithermarum]